MPEPLAMPLSVTLVPSIVVVRVAILGKVSVVMIARAASAQASPRRLGARLDSRPVILSSGSGSPITPVEATKASSGAQLNSRPVASTVRLTEASPIRPVNALALPELTTIARALPPGRQARHQSTGADDVSDLVSAPPIVVPGCSSTTSRSVRFW